jgi:hypothetical protein
MPLKAVKSIQSAKRQAFSAFVPNRIKTGDQ